MLKHEKILFNLKYNASVFMTLTIIYALCFLTFQVYEYCIIDCYLTDGIFGSIFYLLTGLHGFHVFIGTFLIIQNYKYLLLYFVKEKQNLPNLSLKTTQIYWQFVDTVWGFLYIFLYIPLIG